MFDWDKDQEELVSAPSVMLTMPGSAPQTPKRGYSFYLAGMMGVSLFAAACVAVFIYASLPTQRDGTAAAGFYRVSAASAPVRQAVMPEVLMAYSQVQAGEFLQRLQGMSDQDLLTFSEDCTDAMKHNLSGGLLASYWADASALSEAEIVRRQLPVAVLADAQTY